MFFYKSIIGHNHQPSCNNSEISQKINSHFVTLQKNSHSVQKQSNLSNFQVSNDKSKQKVKANNSMNKYQNQNKKNTNGKLQSSFLFSQNSKLFLKRQNFNKRFFFLKESIEYNCQKNNKSAQNITKSQKKLVSLNKNQSPYTQKALNKYSQSLHLKNINQKLKKKENTILFTKITSKILHSPFKHKVIQSSSKNKAIQSSSKNKAIQSSSKNKTLQFSSKNNVIQSSFKNRENSKGQNYHHNSNKKLQKMQQNYKLNDISACNGINQSQFYRQKVIKDLLKGDQQSVNSNKFSQFISKQSSLKRSKNSQCFAYKPQKQSTQRIKFVRYGARTQSCKPIKVNQFKQEEQNQSSQFQQSLFLNEQLLNKSNQKSKRQEEDIQKNNFKLRTNKCDNFYPDMACNNKFKDITNASNLSESSIETLQLFTQYNIKLPQKKNKQNKKIQYDQFLLQKIKILPNLAQQNLKNILNLRNLKKQSNIQNKIKNSKPQNQINTKKLQNQNVLTSSRQQTITSRKKNQEHKKLFSKDKVYQKLKIKSNEKESQIQEKEKQNGKIQQQKQKKLSNPKRLKLKRIQSYQGELKSQKKQFFQIVNKPTQRGSIIKHSKSSFTMKKIDTFQQRQSKRVIFLDQKNQLKDHQTNKNLNQNSQVKRINGNNIKSQVRRKGTFHSNFSIKDMISQDYSEYNSESEGQNKIS